jgi:hypothetical protein
MYHHGLRASEPGKLMLSDYGSAPATGDCAWCASRAASPEWSNTLLDLELSALQAWLHVRGMKPGPLFHSRKHRSLCRL